MMSGIIKSGDLSSTVSVLRKISQSNTLLTSSSTKRKSKKKIKHTRRIGRNWGRRSKISIRCMPNWRSSLKKRRNTKSEWLTSIYDQPKNKFYRKTSKISWLKCTKKTGVKATKRVAASRKSKESKWSSKSSMKAKSNVMTNNKILWLCLCLSDQEGSQPNKWPSKAASLKNVLNRWMNIRTKSTRRSIRKTQTWGKSSLAAATREM